MTIQSKTHTCLCHCPRKLQRLPQHEIYWGFSRLWNCSSNAHQHIIRQSKKSKSVSAKNYVTNRFPALSSATSNTHTVFKVLFHRLTTTPELHTNVCNVPKFTGSVSRTKTGTKVLKILFLLKEHRKTHVKQAGWRQPLFFRVSLPTFKMEVSFFSTGICWDVRTLRSTYPKCALINGAEEGMYVIN